MRADAQRNRDRIVEVARLIFREHGYDASLDLVAKSAGVGPGTLYRHFPTRDALLDAVMQSWVDRVNDAADKALTTEGGSRALLLAWFEAYVDLVTLHKGGAARVTGAMGDEASPIRTKCHALAGATERVLERLREDDAVRDGVDALQVARLVGGVATVADNGDLPPAVVRPMLEVVADGLLR